MDSVIKFVHVIRETNCLFACHVPYLCFAHLVSCGKMSVSKASPGFSGLKGTGAGVTNPADGERRWGQREGPSGTLRINLSPPKRASSTLLSGFCLCNWFAYFSYVIVASCLHLVWCSFKRVFAVHPQLRFTKASKLRQFTTGPICYHMEFNMAVHQNQSQTVR